MITDRFQKIRKKELDSVFTTLNIITTWKKIVKDQLRNFDIKDIYDFYDFNYNIEERAKDLRRSLLNADYQVSKPLIYRIEKKLGICRHIIFPNPLDALVLQVITDKLSAEILPKQPSKNAFYSQDKHTVFQPHQVDPEYGLNWIQQWKKLQKKIYKFNEEFSLIVTTDLSNYYDSIDINLLQKAVAHAIDDKEVLVDLLFKMIENISWTPDFLPYSKRGLPTTNLEGVRLLAHLFLYELDSILIQETKDSFTRWMDDITFGSNSKSQAVALLSTISDVLKSKGLAINGAKTHIFTAEQGKYHFQIDANRYLDSIVIDPEDKKARKKIGRDLLSAFKDHLKDKGPRYWDKVSKRYVTLFGKLKSDKLLKYVTSLFAEHPSLRQGLLRYLGALNYDKQNGEIVLKICESTGIYDDTSLYQLCNLVTSWTISESEQTAAFLSAFEAFLIATSKLRKTFFDFYCILWFKAKYRNPDDIWQFMNHYQNIWKNSPFLRRQAVALTSRLISSHRTETFDLLKAEIFSGNTNTLTLANQIISFSKKLTLDRKLRYYLFPINIQRPYPLSKFLVLCNLLSSESFRNNNIVKELVIKHIDDPYYRLWIKSQFYIG